MSTLLMRYLAPFIKEDLEKKMVFLGGPRQVGKTTLAQSFIRNFSQSSLAYMNWDDPSDKARFQKGQWSANSKVVVFDEIHKYKRWRNTVKGYWDRLKNSHAFIVTGSARLDYYNKGGDSLLGRYHYYRLHPFSWPEIKTQMSSMTVTMEHLLRFGGFPEPLLDGAEKTLRRWHRERNSRIINSDIRDLEHVKDISLIGLLIEALPERVGSPLSRKNLSQDLEVDFKTLEKWIQILENVYYCYRIAPYGAPKIRAVKKEQKVYLWDWSEHEDTGKQWENFVASHLLKYCHFMEDSEGHKMELRFLRDTDGREVDFVVVKNKKPLFAVECKTGDKALSKHIPYFAERTQIPRFFQVHRGVRHHRYSDCIEILPFEKFCEICKLV